MKKRKITSAILVATMITSSLSVCNVTAQEAVYEITTPEELVSFLQGKILDSDENKIVKAVIKNDIVFNEPVEVDEIISCGYIQLDGNYHTVTNMTTKIAGTEYKKSGMASILGESTIKNLTMEYDNFYFYSEDFSKNKYGAIADVSLSCSYENVTIEGTIVSDDSVDVEVFGGVMGQGIDNKYDNCVNNANISIEDNEILGGLVGQDTYSSMTNCQNNGNITSNSERYVGGLAGTIYEGVIENCTNTGEIVSNCEVGGIVGESNSDITACTNLGSIDGDNVGGIVAVRGGSTIQDCLNEGELDGTTVAGIVNQVVNINESVDATVKKCVNKGNLVGKAVSGIVYEYYYADSLLVEDCRNYGVLDTNDRVGVLAKIEGTPSITIKKCVCIADENNMYDLVNEEYINMCTIVDSKVCTEDELEDETSTVEETTVPEETSVQENTSAIQQTSAQNETTKQNVVQNPQTPKKVSTTANKPLKTPTIVNVIGQKKAVKVIWSKKSNITGYQLKYADNSKFEKSKTKTIKSAKTTTYTIKKLKSKKKYYVKLRVYVKSKKGNKYSDWSKTKTSKTK